MKKRTLSIFLVLCLIFSLCPMMTVTAGAVTEGIPLSGELGSDYSLNQNGTYYLASDVVIGNITIAQNAEVILDLNGHVLSGDGTKSVITNKGNLTIKDSNTTAAHTFKESDSIWVLDNSGDKTVYGGCITGGNSSQGGAVVCNYGTTLTLDSGTLIGNTAQYGGAVYLLNSTFNMMEGGTIEHCYASKNSDAIYSNESTINLYNGTIRNNLSCSETVYSNPKSTLHIHGCTITGNAGGSALRIENYNTTLDGECHIIGNTGSASTDNSNILLGPPASSGSVSVTIGNGGASTSGILDSKSEIGVKIAFSNRISTTNYVAFTKENGADYSKCFISDDSKFTVINNKDGGSDKQILMLGIIPHSHAWTYALATGRTDTIAATCTSDCDYTGTDTTLTIEAFNAPYDGKTHDASFGNTTFCGNTLPAISYQYSETKDGTYVDTTDTSKAGFYKASCTVGSVTAYTYYEVEYPIVALEPTKTAEWTTRPSSAKVNVEVQAESNANGITPNVLYLGTMCMAHGLQAGTTEKALNTLAEQANVTYYLFRNGGAGGKSTSDVTPLAAGKIRKGNSLLIDEEKGYIWESFMGGHYSLHPMFYTLNEELNQKKNTYDYIIFAFDSAIFGLNYNFVNGIGFFETDVAEALKPYYENKQIVWITDKYLYETTGSGYNNTAMPVVDEDSNPVLNPNAFANNKPSNYYCSVNTANRSIANTDFYYLSALIDPNFYLTHTVNDIPDGQVFLTDIGEEYKTDYTDVESLSDFLAARITPNNAYSLTVTDTVVTGLTASDIKLQSSSDGTTWTDVSDVSPVFADGTIIATVNNCNSAMQYRLTYKVAVGATFNPDNLSSKSLGKANAVLTPVGFVPTSKDSEEATLEFHNHAWTYAVKEDDSATLTATCSNSGCTATDTSLTISAPALTTYGGTESANATISATVLGGLTVSAMDIKYYQKVDGIYGDALAAAPTAAGDYKATVTVDTDKTAFVEYTIAKATPTVTVAPAASAITYEQTLADSALTDGVASVPGTFTWADNTITPIVPDSNLTEYDVIFTPYDTANYNDTECKVTLTVNKAPTMVITAPETSAIILGQTLADSILTGGEGSVPGSFSWKDGTMVPDITLTENEYEVVFTPDDSDNYLPCECKIKLLCEVRNATFVARHYLGIELVDSIVRTEEGFKDIAGLVIANELGQNVTESYDELASNVIRFRITKLDDCTFDYYTVYVNDVEVTPDEDGVYTIEAGKEDVKITVNGSIEKNDDEENLTLWERFYRFCRALIQYVASWFKWSSNSASDTAGSVSAEMTASADGVDMTAAETEDGVSLKDQFMLLLKGIGQSFGIIAIPFIN